MANVTLVVMAGGLGSRFGGAKQLAEVGPNGEALLDFAIRDARAAGVTRTVVVARSDLEDNLRAHLRSHHPADLDLEVVHQDAHGPSRTKPWGPATPWWPPPSLWMVQRWCSTRMTSTVRPVWCG